MGMRGCPKRGRAALEMSYFVPRSGRKAHIQCGGYAVTVARVVYRYSSRVVREPFVNSG